MSKESTSPTLKWILIAIIGLMVLGAVLFVLYATYPAEDYHVARKLQARGFDIVYNVHDDSWIWQRPTHVSGSDQSITTDDSRLIFQLPRLYALLFLRCDASGLNLEGIENCQELTHFTFHSVTRFPVSELSKLTATPVNYVSVQSRNVHLNDSDLEEFAKFTHLETIYLEFNNTGVTDACLEYFEKIPTLKELGLPKSSITQEGVEEFQKKRPDVKVYFE